jgi:hypothetical protein
VQQQQQLLQGWCSALRLAAAAHEEVTLLGGHMTLQKLQVQRLPLLLQDYHKLPAAAGEAVQDCAKPRIGF